MNETETMSLYKKYYADAVEKQLGEKYLWLVYQDGDATYEMLNQVAMLNHTTPIGLLCKYRNWQEDEKLCEMIRNPKKHVTFKEMFDKYINNDVVVLDKTFQQLLTRI